MFVQRNTLSLDFSDSTLFLLTTCSRRIAANIRSVFLPATHLREGEQRLAAHFQVCTERECAWGRGLWGCYHRGMVPRGPCGILLMAKSNRADRLKQSYL